MTTDLAKSKFQGTAEIRHHDGPFMIPDSMTPRQALKALKSLIDQQEEVTEFSRVFQCLPQDGAAALNRVLIDFYGWSTGIPTPGFFGDSPPQMITVETDVNTSIQVPWGRLALPNLEGGGFVATGLSMENGMLCFRLYAECKRKDSGFIEMKLFNGVANELKERSLYKGKCFTIQFTDSDGEVLELPETKFVDLSGFDLNKLILPKETERAMQLAVWAPIMHHEKYRKQFGNLKRGVLMEGTYGTGKTLSVSNTAKLAKDQGFTVVYCKKTTEFEKALRVTRNYQNPNGMIVVEDIDIELAAGRSDALNQIINTLDGMETKRDNIITLMTTNDLESIEPAAVRQGRVSAKIRFTYPDLYAIEKLVRVNANDKLDKKADLSEVVKIMEGMNPAEIEEAVTMADLAHLHLTGELSKKITVEDLSTAAKYMCDQAEIQRHIEKIHEKVEPVTVDKVIDGILEERFDKREGKLLKDIGGIVKDVIRG